MLSTFKGQAITLRSTVYQLEADSLQNHFYSKSGRTELEVSPLVRSVL